MTSYHLPSARPTVLEDIMQLINVNIQARFQGPPAAATPESMITLKRALEALNAVIKEFVNMKMLSGIRTCGKVRARL